MAEQATAEDRIQEPDLGDMKVDFGEEEPDEAANAEEGETPEEPEDDETGEEGQEESGEEQDDADYSDVEFDEKQQEVFNREIGKKVAKQKQAEREAQELRERIEALEAKQPQEERPEVPEVPDKTDPDYAEKIDEYNKAVLAANEYDRNEKELSEAKRAEAEEKQKKILDEFNEAVDVYAQRSTKLGIKPEQLQQAGKVVAGYGLHDAVAAYIVEEPLGPQITVYLSKNPKVAEELSKLSPMQAAARIATDIKADAQKTGKKVDDTPEPSESLKGGGSEEDDGYGPKNTKYTLE